MKTVFSSYIQTGDEQNLQSEYMAFFFSES